jgi:hypothetical protein
MTTGAMMMPLGPDGGCPACGSADISEFGLPPMTASIVTGQEQFDPGDVIGEVIDPMEFAMHPHSQTFEQSPWAIRTRLFDARVLEAHFPWAEIPRAVTTDMRLIYQRIAQLDPGLDYSFIADGALHEMGTLEEFWFEPALYCHYVTPDHPGGDLDLGQKVAFMERYPKGLYLQRLGRRIADGPWPAEKNEEIVHGRFDVVMQSIWGRGQDDAVSSNERYEEMGTLGFEIAMHHASSPMAVNQAKIDWSTADGHPRAMMKMLNASEDDDPSKYIWQGSSQAASGLVGVNAGMDREQQTMQQQFAAFAAFRGDSEGRAETATRTAILRDQAREQHASPVELKEEVDARSSMLRLKLYQANWQGTRVFFSKGEYDDLEAQYFERSDIQGDLIAVARRGSGMPRGESERRAAAIEAGTWGQLPGGVWNQAVPQRVRKFVLEELGIYHDLDEIAPDYRKQRYEIRRLQELVPDVLAAFEERGVMAMMPPGLPLADGTFSEEETPNEGIALFLAQKIPVEIARPLDAPPGMNIGMSIDNDDVHITECRRWLLSDDGLKAHPVFRRAIMIHITEHVNAAVLTAQYQSLAQAGGAAPANALAQRDAAISAQIEADAKANAGKSGPDSGKKTAEPSQSNRPTADSLQRQLT